jgi:hypothetical protein
MGGGDEAGIEVGDGGRKQGREIRKSGKFLMAN